ncbi:MAG: cyclic nucleotide-binding domain-containing protein [Bacteroidetes bacterium]|nr:cyclic nucleotide-binding domain-containing protein [Bacteroidota bacterium]MDA1121820.1 cyclic nucleotide-binding domain-containing protein [Bacteroidota bacterium]
MMNPFKRSYTSEEINLFRFLSKIKLFEALNYEELFEFVPNMYLRSYKLDEVVFFRKDPSHALYVIKNGQVSLNIDVNGEFQPLTTIKSGEAFGDNALLPGAKRIYTSIVASENADLYVIPQVNILEVFQGGAKIKAKMMGSFAELYNSYTTNIFKAYRSDFGFFDLAQAYKKED